MTVKFRVLTKAKVALQKHGLCLKAISPLHAKTHRCNQISSYQFIQKNFLFTLRRNSQSVLILIELLILLFFA